MTLALLCSFACVSGIVVHTKVHAAPGFLITGIAIFGYMLIHAASGMLPH